MRETAAGMLRGINYGENRKPPVGFEPTTCALRMRRSDQLSYGGGHRSFSRTDGQYWFKVGVSQPLGLVVIGAPIDGKSAYNGGLWIRSDFQ